MTLLSRTRTADKTAPLKTVEEVAASLRPADDDPAESPPDTPTMTARPMSGIGLAMRQGDLILVCTETGVGAVVSAFADVVAAGGDGMMLVRRIAAVLADDFAGEVAACAACGPTRDGRLAVLVYGGARALVDADGSPTLSGDQDIAAVCRLLPQPVDALRLELPGAADPDPRTRLDVGVVVAAGVSVTFTGGLPIPPPAAPAPPRRPKPRVTAPATVPVPVPVDVAPGRRPADHSHDTQHVDVSHGRQSAGHSPGRKQAAWGGTSEHPMVPMPVPMPEAPTWPPAVARPHPPGTGGRPVPGRNGTRPRPSTPVVRGLGCAAGHFNDPRLAYCAVCGTSMTAASSHELEGARPPLGVLLLDLGGTFVLDADIVVGREPEVDPDVASGLARPLILDEPAQRVSRRHARITVIDWDVFVVDLGSTNGTRLQRPDEPPMRIPVQALTPITPGTIIWLADRWIRYESNRDPLGPTDDHGTR